LPNSIPTTLAAVAVFISFINIFGGFMVTHKMLDMFKRKQDAPEHNYLYTIPALAFMACYTYLAFKSGNLSSLTQMAYLTSSLLCILSLGGLSAQATARLGM